MSEPLINRYRPRGFAEVIGHDEKLAALQRAMASDSHPHAYLLTGMRGVGKTSIARIIAEFFECELVEVPAAVYSGVAEMRSLVEDANHRGMKEGEHHVGHRLFLLDEVHRFSRAAFDALLKTLEEPARYIYFVLCTTEADKVPDTIKSRCYKLELKPLQRDDMDILLQTIADLESWTVTNDVMAAVVDASEGSPREALTMLQAVHDATTRDEVRRVVDLRHDAGAPLVELLRLMLGGRGSNWPNMRRLLARLDTDYEQNLIAAGRYLGGVMLRADEPEATRAWQILDALVYPSTTFDPKARFIAAIGRFMWGAE